MRKISTPAEPANQPTAALKAYEGIVTLQVAGRAMSPVIADVRSCSSPASIAAAANAGVSLFRLVEVELGWNGLSSFDYSDIERRLETLSVAAPAARIFLHIRVDAPAWWLAAHPDEAVGYCSKTPAPELAVSWASRKWRSESGNALGRLLRRLGDSKWSSRIVAVQPAAGHGGQWLYRNLELMPDNGPRMTERFRSWTKEKYRRNGGLLKQAWHDVRPDFQNLSCPDSHDRGRSDFGILRNPATTRYVIDYFECLAETQAAAAVQFCDVVRAAAPGLLAGLGFAPLNTAVLHAEASCVGLEAILASDNVDFVANLANPDSPTTPNSFVSSIALAGKLAVHIASDTARPYVAAAVAETRHIGLAMAVETAPDTWRGVMALMDSATRSPARVRARTSQAAIVIDPTAACYTANRRQSLTWLHDALVGGAVRSMERTGAPFEIHLLSDLFRKDFPNYRVLLFPNTFYLSQSERRNIDAKVKRAGQTAVWLWPAGAIDEVGVSADASARLVGCKVRLEAVETQFRSRIADGSDPVTWGWHVGAAFGLEQAMSPTLTVPDKQCIRVGANSANKTSIAVKRDDRWTTVVSAAAPLPTSILRNILKSAGCHIYTDRDDVRITADGRSIGMIADVATAARGSLPGVHDVTELGAGRKIAVHVSLPGVHDVTELGTGREIAAGVSDFQAEVQSNDAIAFELNSIRKAAGRDPARAG